MLRPWKVWSPVLALVLALAVTMTAQGQPTKVYRIGFLGTTSPKSHGDFVNRRLGVTNTVVLSDEGTRERGVIRLEAYDEALMSMITSRHSDTLAPDFWRGGASPADAIARDEPVVYVLIHPRHWRRSPLRNARDDARRMIEGTSFRLGIGIRRSLSWRGSPA